MFTVTGFGDDFMLKCILITHIHLDKKGANLTDDILKFIFINEKICISNLS